jgi:N-acetylglutamate synthase
MQLPPVGTRVMVRYRLRAGSVPPLTDVIGHLLDTGPTLRVRTKRGDVVAVALGDVVAIKALAAAPVRTSEIRATEHAAALAWPGFERQWLNGWLLRAAGGHTHRGNSAMPLGVEADFRALPSIVDWYGSRGLTPWLSVADRLLRLPADIEPHLETFVMVRDVASGEPDAMVTLAPRPDKRWLQVYERDVPVDVLTAVDGEVVFGSISDAVQRARTCRSWSTTPRRSRSTNRWVSRRSTGRAMSMLVRCSACGWPRGTSTPSAPA